MKSCVYYSLLLCLIFFGCTVEQSAKQSFDINEFPERSQNEKLAYDLTWYPKEYLMAKIPSYNDSTAKGITIGYSIGSKLTHPQYIVDYNMDIPAVANNIKTLQAEFKAFIPTFIKKHMAKVPLFKELEPKGKEWVTSLFTANSKELWNAGSPKLIETTTYEEFESLVMKMRSVYGTPTLTTFARAQYLESFLTIEESIWLFFEQSYDSGRHALVRVHFHEIDGKWLPYGMKVKEIN